LTIIVSFSIGTNDETMAVVAGSGFISVKKVVIIGGILNIVGAIFLSGNVRKTVGESLVNNIELIKSITYQGFILVAISILLSTSIWLIVASYLKWPVSATQAIVGSLIGTSLFLAGPNVINFTTLIYIICGWIFSPIIGFTLGYLINKVTYYSFRRYKSLDKLVRVEKIFLYLTFIAACLTNISRGGNDIANAVTPLVNIFGDNLIPFIIGGLGMGAGVVMLGKRVIKNVGIGLVNIAPGSAFSSQATTAIIMLTATILGIPLSATHVLVSSIVGMAFSDGTPVNTQALKGIAISWVITLPLSAFLGILIYALFSPLLV